MDPVESAAEMIAEDAIRMAKRRGATSPDEVEVDLGSGTTETSEGLTEERVQELVRERWDDPETDAEARAEADEATED